MKPAVAVTSDELQIARRLRRFEISSAFFPMAMTDGLVYEITAGVPAGCQLYNMQYDYRLGVFYIVLEHETFDLVPGGGEIPQGTIKFRKIFDGGSISPAQAKRMNDEAKNQTT